MTSKVKEITLGKGHLFKPQIPSKSRLAQKYNRSKEKTTLRIKTNSCQSIVKMVVYPNNSIQFEAYKFISNI